MESIAGTQSLRDTLTLKKRSKKFFILEGKSDGDVFWNDLFLKLLGEIRISIKNQEFDIKPDNRAYFTNTKLTTKFSDKNENETVFDILEKVGFYDNIPKKGRKSA